MKDTYRTITIDSKGVYKDKGSKFFAFAFPVDNANQAKKHLEKIKKEFYDARHHCYAYAIGFNRENYRMNDDGEPSGSAGKPIYGQILSLDITNSLIIVVRYFGGTKLGIRGLINAYRNAALDALHNNKIQEKRIENICQLNFEYPFMNDVMRVIKDQKLHVIDQEFLTSCKLTFKVRMSETEKISSIFQSMKGIKFAIKDF